MAMVNVLILASLVAAPLTAQGVSRQLNLGRTSVAVQLRDISAVDPLIRTARAYLGKQYVYGGTGGPGSGYDCSGLVQTVYRRHGYLLPRTAHEQVMLGEAVTEDDIRPGDLLFFTSSPNSSRITHVAIAIGNNMMIHAARHYQRVVVSRWDSHYYRARWFATRRLRYPTVADATP